jgi:hypothetical protein
MVRSQRNGFSDYKTSDAPFLNVGSLAFGVVDERYLERSFLDAARRLRSELVRLSDGVASGSISVQGYTIRARVAVRTAFFTAYSVGAMSVFPFYTLTDRDVRILDDELDQETGFLRQFGRDLARGSIRLDPVTRAGLYLLALRGIFERGRVEAMPTGPYRWQLGITEHCDECFRASIEGPYQRDRYSGLGLTALPGSPGDGTVCLGLTRCGCRVVLATGAPVPGEALADRLRGLLLEVAHGSSRVAQGT